MLTEKELIEKLTKECNRLEEYKSAYEYLLEYWESFDKEQKREINKELNKIFVINNCEQIENE